MTMEQAHFYTPETPLVKAKEFTYDKTLQEQRLGEKEEHQNLRNSEVNG